MNGLRFILLALAWCVLAVITACGTPACSTEGSGSAATSEDDSTADSTPQAAAAPTVETQAKPTPPAPTEVHACAGAWKWFPGDAASLRKAVEGYLEGEKPPVDKAPLALIVPHAGYQFSGPTAGKAYATLKGHKYDRVILLGLSHTQPVQKASVLRVAAYETPLGRIPVDVAAVDTLLACPVVTEQPACHKVEWSVENQLPFLQCTLGDFKMVDLIVGALTEADRAALAKVLRGMLDGKTLLVASSDFTHFGANYGYMPFTDDVPRKLQVLNDMAVSHILQMDVRGWDKHLADTGDTICGRYGIGLLLKTIAPLENVRAIRAARTSSGDITGDLRNSVTYASIVFWQAGGGLSEAEQQTLLRIARDAVTRFLEGRGVLEPDPATYPLTAALKAPGAAFVTLKNQGRLRGCIGHITAIEPLVQSVIRNACNACQDPRFRLEPITKDEAKDLTVEISVLSPPRRVTDFSSIVIGRDGLIMARGNRRGVFLPQVPVEEGWDLTQYLTYLCGKAGLPVGAWKDPDTELYAFTAQVFHEKE